MLLARNVHQVVAKRGLPFYRVYGHPRYHVRDRQDCRGCAHLPLCLTQLIGVGFVRATDQTSSPHIGRDMRELVRVHERKVERPWNLGVCLI